MNDEFSEKLTIVSFRAGQFREDLISPNTCGHTLTLNSHHLVWFS